MKNKTISAQSLLIAIVGLAGLGFKSDIKSLPSEQESLEILSLISNTQQSKVIEILKASQIRDLEPSEAQILQSLTEKGAEILVARPEPMY